MHVIIQSPFASLAQTVADQLHGHRPDVPVEVLQGPACGYALLIPSDLPASHRKEVRKALRPLRPPARDQQPGEPVRLLLGPEALGRWPIRLLADDRSLIDTMVKQAEGFGLRISSTEYAHVPCSMIHLTSAPRSVTDVIRWWAWQSGVALENQSDDSALGAEVVVEVRSPAHEGKQPRSYHELVVRGDESTVVDATASALIENEFSIKVDSGGERIWQPSDRLALIPGPFAHEQANGDRKKLLHIVQSTLVKQGIDLGMYPLSVITGKADQPASLELPTGLARQGRLEPYGHQAPRQFDATVYCDDPQARDRLLAELRMLGLGLVLPFPLAEPKGFRIRWGAAASSPAIRSKLRAVVQAAIDEAALPDCHHIFETDSPDDDYPDEDSDPVTIEFPIAAARDGHLKVVAREAASSHAVRILSAGAASTRDRTLADALSRFGLLDVKLAGMSERGVGIAYGGAPPALVDHVRTVVLEICGVDLPAQKQWDDSDNDIFVHLPVSGPNDPSDEGSLAWRSPTPAPPLQGRPVRRPFLIQDGDSVRVGPITLSRRQGHTNMPVPAIASFESHCIDQSTAEVLLHVAEAVRLAEPCLLEGGTGTAKTTSVLMLAAWLNQPVLRVNLHGQTDASEMVGRFTPTVGASGGWTWVDGAVPLALDHGCWLLIDEVNLAEPQNLERLNSVLESPPSLVLAEHDLRVYGRGGRDVHPLFRVFGTMNPQDEPGRSPLSQAWRDRWSAHLQLSTPTERDVLSVLRFLVFGEQPSVQVRDVLYAKRVVTPPYPNARKHDAIEPFIDRLATFHVGMAHAMAQVGGVGADRTEPLVFTRRALRSVVALLHLAPRGAGSTAAYQEAVNRYYLAKLTESEKRVAWRLMDACGLSALLQGERS